MTVGIISHESCMAHDVGVSHPECPARLESIQSHLKESSLGSKIQHFEAQSIDRPLLSLAHDLSYVDYLFENSPDQGLFQLDPDTAMTPETLSAALHAAGAVIQGVDLVMSSELSSVFCATRPPGHHAERGRAMGFCYFNSVAIAAAYALKHYQLERVVILDFDVHHGNGTENIVSDQEGILFCSTFQHPFYPFSGGGKTATNIINTPLSANADSTEFRRAVTDHWLPALIQFKPDLMIISAGFDAHAEDVMSQVQLYESDYRWVTDELKTIADQYCQGRIVSALEGGYNLDALGRSVVAHIEGLVGD